MFKKSKPALQVIDFGVSIDMALFPDGTTFTHCFEKMESKSPDMLEGRPWTYQVSVWGAPTKIIEYSGDLNCKLVRYSNGPKQFAS